MFQKTNVPILGVIENMSYFTCPHCQGRSEIFAHGGARHEAERLGVPFLGEVPLALSIREQADSGTPTAAVDADSAAGRRLSRDRRPREGRGSRGRGSARRRASRWNEDEWAYDTLIVRAPKARLEPDLGTTLVVRDGPSDPHHEVTLNSAPSAGTRRSVRPADAEIDNFDERVFPGRGREQFERVARHGAVMARALDRILERAVPA